MPQRRNDPPAGSMTWGRALPVLAVCVIFDAARMFFEWFWFLGPALAALYCTVKTSASLSAWTLGIAGTKTAAVLCSSAATVIGAAGVEVTAPFGVIMAMTVGLLGWGTVTLILAITNPGIWKSNIWGWIWSICALGISEVPLLGTVPMLTITHVRLYAGQIKQDKAALERYQQEQGKVTAAARSLQQRRALAQMQKQAVAEEEIPEEMLGTT